jgi:hypothetical protein
MARFFLMVVSVLLWSSSATAVNLETLVMPGKVISGHAKYEEQCDKCHEAFSKKSQRRLCLECHKEIAADISKQTGLHGRDSDIRKVECKQCHSDHLGRDADIVQFNKDLFDHDRADFKLRDAHARQPCAACHKVDQPYRKTPSACYDCHKKQDVHEGKFDKDCSKCHGVDVWKKQKFDHSKTKYPLTGKHAEVNCGLCHPGNQYKGISQLCVDCHRLNDVHANKYGAKCQECHSTKGWKGYNFDHDVKTKFKLLFKHKDAKCDTCHKSDYEKKLKTTCISCHKEQDTHKGVLGEKCGDCHDENVWRKHTFDHKRFSNTQCIDCHKHDDVHKGRYDKKCESCHKTDEWKKGGFDHTKKTKFPLLGKHKDVKCSSCHQGDASKERDKRECHLCHAVDDVHQGKLGKKCESCHRESGWRKEVKFDHDLSQFPLVGLHATAPCEACHVQSTYKDTKRDCLACHKSDDEHKARLGPRCEQCHNPNSWKFWQFDHNKQSDFKLKGKHEGLVCEACHRTEVKEKIKLAKDCASCHRGDDVHNGNFGRQCDRCHNDRDFREISLKQ